jgi:single-strand DNA-binding protein
MQEESINTIKLRGYVQKEPQIRYFTDKNVKAYFPLLTFDLYKSQTETKRIPEYHNIVAWKEIAEQVETEIKENQFIEVIGRLKTNNYEKDGQQKISVQIVISSFKVIREARIEEVQTQYPSSVENSKLTDLSDDLLSDEEDDILPF